MVGVTFISSFAQLKVSKENSKMCPRISHKSILWSDRCNLTPYDMSMLLHVQRQGWWPVKRIPRTLFLRHRSSHRLQFTYPTFSGVDLADVMFLCPFVFRWWRDLATTCPDCSPVHRNLCSAGTMALRIEAFRLMGCTL